MQFKINLINELKILKVHTHRKIDSKLTYEALLIKILIFFALWMITGILKLTEKLNKSIQKVV